MLLPSTIPHISDHLRRYGRTRPVNFRRFVKSEVDFFHFVPAAAVVLPFDGLSRQKNDITGPWKSCDSFERNQIDSRIPLRKFEAVLAHVLNLSAL
jgi:hypothetical protein